MTDTVLKFVEGDTLPELSVTFRGQDLTSYQALRLVIGYKPNALTIDATPIDLATGRFKFAWAEQIDVELAEDVEAGDEQLTLSAPDYASLPTSGELRLDVGGDVEKVLYTKAGSNKLDLSTPLDVDHAVGCVVSLLPSLRAGTHPVKIVLTDSDGKVLSFDQLQFEISSFARGPRVVNVGGSVTLVSEDNTLNISSVLIGPSITVYDTTSDLLAASPADGTVARANDDGTKTYNRLDGAWEIIATRSYVDDADATTLQAAKDYTDAASSSGANAYTDTAVAAALATAEAYADAQDTATLTAAESYAASHDATNLQAAKDYADAQDVTNLAAATDYADNTTLPAAKDYANTQDAATLASAEAYTDDAIATALASAGSSADSGDAATLSSAQGYTDDAVSSATTDLQAYADAAAATALTTAESYASSHDATTLTSAEAYADSKDADTLASAQSYADTQDAAILTSANDHADTGDATTLQDAKDYADLQDATVASNAQAAADAAEAAAVTAAESYTDTAVAAGITTAEAFATSADSVVSAAFASADAANLVTAKAYADTKDAATLTSAQSYASSHDATNLQAAKDYADTQDATVLATAEQYTDDENDQLNTLLREYIDSRDNAILEEAIDYVDSSVIPTSRQVIAGAGLIGGGPLASDVTLNVGAGTGIAVNANDVQLATIADQRVLANTSGGTAAPVPTAGAALEAIVRAAIAALTANPNFNAKRLTNVADPTSAQDVATKIYADTSALDSVLLFPSGGDDATLVQAALNAVPAKGGKVMLARGVWHFSFAPVIPNDRHIVFGGQDPTDALSGGLAQIYATMTDGSDLISVNNTGWSGSTYLTGVSTVLQNMALIDQSFGVNVGSMLKVRNRAKLVLNNIVTYGGKLGFDLDSCFIIEFNSCKTTYAQKYGYKLVGCAEVFWNNCQAAGTGIFDGSLAANEGYGLFMRNCTSSRYEGDLSTNGVHKNNDGGDFGGGFRFESCQQCRVEGYYEASDSSQFSSRVGYCDSQTQGNDFEDLFHAGESAIEDHGSNNKKSNTQTSRGIEVASGKVTNWLVDSSFERATPERWFGSAQLSIQATGTSDGPVSGRCMRIKNNTGSHGTVNAEHYFSGTNGVTSLTQLKAGQTVAYRIWARGTKPAGAPFKSRLQLSVGGSVPIAYYGSPIPYLDTVWREVEFSGVMTADWNDGLIVLNATLDDQDYFEVGDGMIIVSEEGREVFRVPYIRTGTSLTERSASLEVPDLSPYALINTDLKLGSDKKVAWYSGTGVTGSPDLALVRASAGLLKITDGSTGMGALQVIASNSVAGIYFGSTISGSTSALWSSGTLIYAASGTNSTYTDFAARDITANRNIIVTGTVDGRDVSADGAALDAHVAATAAHGATGAVVGTTNSQTLTNKTLDAAGISTYLTFTDQAGAATSDGRLQRNGAALSFHDGTSARTLVSRDASETLTNKTLTAPVIATIVNTGTLTLPTSTDTLVGRATSDTLTNKTLTTPTIGDFTNATHTHQSSAQGGTLDAAAIAAGTMATARLGSGTASSAKFLRGDQTWSDTIVGTLIATTFSGALSGNASTATALQTARNIAGTSFDGTASISITHANLSSLSADDHTQYALLAGRSGGQTLMGGTGSGDGLTISTTSNSTKGKFAVSTLWAIDEANSLQLMGSGMHVRWSSTSSFSGSADIGLTRGGASVLKVTDGSSGFGAINVIASNSVAGIYFGTASSSSSALWSSGTTIYAASGTNSTYVDFLARDINPQRNLTMQGVGAHVFLGSGADIEWNSGTTGGTGGNDTSIGRAAAGVLSTISGGAWSAPYGSGTNASGDDARVQAGLATGTAQPNVVRLRAGALGTGSGTTQHTAVDRDVIGAGKTQFTNGAATGIIDFTLTAGSGMAAEISYCIEANDGTDHQQVYGKVVVVAVNKGGTYTSTVSTPTETSACSTGTLSGAFSVVNGTNKITFKITPTSSLTPTTLRVTHSIRNLGQQALTIL